MNQQNEDNFIYVPPPGKKKKSVKNEQKRPKKSVAELTDFLLERMDTDAFYRAYEGYKICDIRSWHAEIEKDQGAEKALCALTIVRDQYDLLMNDL